MRKAILRNLANCLCPQAAPRFPWDTGVSDGQTLTELALRFPATFRMTTSPVPASPEPLHYACSARVAMCAGHGYMTLEDT